MSTSGTIRTGIGGWTFEPWEGTFYPEKLPKKRQLEHASRQLTAIEVNGTYYSSQKPETFAKWASEVPEDFVFSLKASRFVTNRRVLAEAGESMTKFLTQGLTELGSHLGPILWQFAPTKIRCGGFRCISGAAARKAGRAHSSPCRGGAQPDISGSGIHRTSCQAQGRRRLR